MPKKQQDVFLILVSLIIGIVIGFGFLSRYYSVGPFADLHATPSSARLNAGGSWSIRPPSFWIPSTELCTGYSAKDTGGMITDSSTGEQLRQCSSVVQ